MVHNQLPKVVLGPTESRSSYRKGQCIAYPARGMGKMTEYSDTSEWVSPVSQLDFKSRRLESYTRKLVTRATEPLKAWK
jgi:hypothetical protein